MSSIKDKVVIITGASSGIGEETAKELADKGANIVLAARREERLRDLQETLKSNGSKVIYQVTDVASYEEMEALAEKAHSEFGKIDVIVNNAGLMPLSLLNKRKVDEWNQMIDVNIKGVLHGIAAVLPYMRERKEGHIINVSSVAGHSVSPGTAVYSGTKYAVRAITEGLRKEESVNSNIRATIISPGAVSTELTDTITDEDVKAGVEKNYQQAIKPDSIARTIRFAIEEPSEVGINEILVRPTAQEK
ncbi:SDR family oxidoreductase [Halobacillus amylolyticus]|uniref:SDR family oxidoreductase n=1 Tax=Halobacillus amylolyticus TaxID=2932259 RepID=A0ABY4HIM8_9BACI|nr:SDR family oxidoreductase [Halobacillus amylolyticus]UOR13295.1 SDR family oxidoreductase [Halobacillus amylolyticus]